MRHNPQTCIDLACPYCGPLGHALGGPASVVKSIGRKLKKATRQPKNTQRGGTSTLQSQRATSRQTRRTSGSLVPEGVVSLQRKHSRQTRRVSGSLVRGGRQMLQAKTQGGAGTRQIKGRRLRFSRVRNRLARKLGLRVRKTQSGYSYPAISEAVQQSIPNYYEESRKLRLLEPIPEEASGFARQIGRHIFAQMPGDPDRGRTVEETIANVLDYSANRALAAGDQQNADYLTKISRRWRRTIGKAQAAIDPDAPIDGDTGLAGIVPTVLRPANHKALAIAGIASVVVGLTQYNRGARSTADRRALLWAAGTALATTALINTVQSNAEAAESE